MVANVFGILHNRKLRSNLHNHAMLLRRHAANMDLISSEVIQCQELLANIFPPQVLAQLQNTIPGMDRASPGQSIAERFEDCTFLFAKIVGLKQITEDEERDPHDVVAALQNIFDRYDALTETFKKLSSAFGSGVATHPPFAKTSVAAFGMLAKCGRGELLGCT